MDITETRRANLRRWVAENGTPPNEKSLFSQLKSTGSFGEKVARRLEAQYNMGEGYLDGVSAPVSRMPHADRKPEQVEPRPARMVLAYDDEERLLDLYRRADERGQRAILKLAAREAGDATHIVSNKA